MWKSGNEWKHLEKKKSKPECMDKVVGLQLNIQAISLDGERESLSLAGVSLLHGSGGVTGGLPSISHRWKWWWSSRRHLVSWVLHVLWVVLQTADELCDRMALVADLIHCTEQREPGRRRSHCWVELTPESPCFKKKNTGTTKQHCVCIWIREPSPLSVPYLLVNQVFVLEDDMDFSCCCWSLQLLAVQHLLLQLLDGLQRENIGEEAFTAASITLKIILKLP